MKRRFGVAAIAAAAGCAVIFAGCTGCNGCGANQKANEAAFSSNWYADTNYRYIQPNFVGAENAEIINYSVTHDRETAGNASYSVEYAGGAYTTTFYAAKFDKALIDEEYRDAYPDDLTVYCYKTKLTFDSVTFKMKNSEDSKTFDKTNGEGENTETECYFTDVNSHLRPLYSKLTTSCHIPAEYQTSDINETYEVVKQTVTTSYKYDGTAAKTVIADEVDGTNNSTKTVNGLDKTDNSLIDVCGLNTAIRAMQLSASFTQLISVYSPAGGMQNYTFAGSADALGEEERKAYEGILENKKLYESGEGKSLNTVCVTAALNAEMKGVSQKYWFAAIENAKNNRGRTTMVKMSVPLAFSLGTLNYSLKEITKTVI